MEEQRFNLDTLEIESIKQVPKANEEVESIKAVLDTETHLEVKNYMSEYNETLKKQLLIEGEKIVVDAGMGYGKSVSSANISKDIISNHNFDNNFIVVITTHTVPLGEQIYTKNLKDFKDAMFFGQNTKLQEKKKIIVCVYDKLDKVKEFYKDKDIILFVDECHELIEGSGYRPKAMDTLEDFINNSYSSIFLSGTTEVFEMAQKYLNKNLFNKIIRFSKTDKETKMDILNVLFSETKEETLMDTIEYLRNKNRKIFLTINSKKQIQFIKRLIEEKYSGIKIIDIDSDKKQTKAFKTLIANKQIDFDIIISTKLFETGISLEYENMSTIRYCTNITQVTLNSICQNFVRVRTHQEECFLILNKNEEDTPIRSKNDIYENKLKEANDDKEYFEKQLKSASPYRRENLTNVLKTFSYFVVDSKEKTITINEKALLNEAFLEYQTQFLYFKNNKELTKKLKKKLEVNEIKVVDSKQLSKENNEKLQEIKENLQEIDNFHLSEYKEKLWKVFFVEQECYSLVDTLEELNLTEANNIIQKQKIDDTKAKINKKIRELEGNYLNLDIRIKSFKNYLKTKEIKEIKDFDDYDKMIMLNVKNYEVLENKLKNLTKFDRYDYFKQFIESKFNDDFIEQQIVIGYNNDFTLEELKDMANQNTYKKEFLEYAVIRIQFDDDIKKQKRVTELKLKKLNSTLIDMKLKKKPKKTLNNSISTRTKESLIKKIGLVYNLASDNKGYRISSLKS